jgi:hypothetical protein
MRPIRVHFGVILQNMPVPSTVVKHDCPAQWISDRSVSQSLSPPSQFASCLLSPVPGSGDLPVGAVDLFDGREDGVHVDMEDAAFHGWDDSMGRASGTWALSELWAL